MGIGMKLNAFRTHLRHASINNFFIQFEIGDTVTDQSPDTVGLFVQGDLMAGTGQLLGTSHSGRAGADHGNTLAGLVLGN